MRDVELSSHLCPVIRVCMYACVYYVMCLCVCLYSVVRDALEFVYVSLCDVCEM